MSISDMWMVEQFSLSAFVSALSSFLDLLPPYSSPELLLTNECMVLQHPEHENEHEKIYGY
jgi:hypothetical protein